MFRFPQAIYPICDVPSGTRTHVELAGAILAGGARFLQLRVKNRPTREFVEIARAVKRLTDAAGVQLIINDRVDIALLIDAAGVHVGQDDLPLKATRQLLGSQRIVGFSTHNAAQLNAAAATGLADYLAFGPIFPTRSKENPDPVQGLDNLGQIRTLTDLPLVAIGGITADHVRAVLASGADAVAVIGAIAGSPDPAAATSRLLQIAGSFRSPLKKGDASTGSA